MNTNSTSKDAAPKSKSALAREALERGERTFTATCIHHGEQPHYASTRACVTCQAGRNSPKNAAAAERYRNDPEYRAHFRETNNAARGKRRANPEYREAERAYERERWANLYATSEDFRGRKREGNAAKDWRDKTGGNMAGWYGLEREVLQQRYGACRPGFEIDHGIPKVAFDSMRQHVASGLHCVANTDQMPKKLNNWKRNQFDPDTDRRQRPANRHRGGAFDPKPTEHERWLIGQAETHGTPAEVSLAALIGALDAKAREYDQHVDAVLSKLRMRSPDHEALP